MNRWLAALPIEASVALYLLVYLPNVILTRLATAGIDPQLGRQLTGLEILPASLIISLVLTYAFIWLSGWYRDAHMVTIGSARLPLPTRWTMLSGAGTALILFTVPLSFTIQNVSIPFMQLLMRSDILIIAPLVDTVFGRRVRWWSWVALAMVMVALLITLFDRGGLHLPPIAVVTVALYTLGYFLRLFVMTKVSKSGEPASVRAYFVEEKIVALPFAVAVLALLSVLGLGGQSGELRFGFVQVWSDPAIWQIVWIGLTLTVLSVLSIVILLDPRENAFCVPLERAASLIAGVGGAVLMAWLWGQKMPRSSELVGAAILIAAIIVLSLASRLSARSARAEA